MLKGENVIKVFITLITLIATFLPVGMLKAQGTSVQNQEGIGFKETLSYTQDHTWFAKKDWQNGLSEVKQSRQSQPWRMGSWEERVNYFISRLKKGDRKVFLYVNYGLLDGYGNPYTHRSVKGYPTDSGKTVSRGVLWYLLAKARKLNVGMEQALTNGNPNTRSKVVKAVLSGLFNKDPRVRLVAINILRRLRPDPSMMKDVKRAMVLETVTTERSKWREKDIDIPSIEQPRLGWHAVAWNGSGISNVETSIRELWYDGSGRGEQDILDGNGKGRYLSEGIYRQGYLNYYPGMVTKTNYSDPQAETISTQVWLKSPMLRYGADGHVSDFENRYGLTEKESILRHTYLYSDPIDPKTQQIGENLYYAYHSVWEEMKKLELFITRSIWVKKIKDGNINSLRILSKDSFRALADQIDGESLENVPMKSRTFKIFGEAEVRAIIVGMLENRVVSTREECIRFLKRLFDEPDLSIPVKREIKKSLREARRRELIIDTIRGRHVHALLTVTQKPDDWWGEEDETNTSVWKNSSNSSKLKHYRNQIEFPEESDIIYHDRRKPGQEEDEKVDGVDAEANNDENNIDSDSDDLSSNLNSQDNLLYGHPLLMRVFNYGKLTQEDIEDYLQIESFILNVNSSNRSIASNMASRNNSLASLIRFLPGQEPGLKNAIESSLRNRSIVASRYEIIRAIETLHSLLLGNAGDLLKASYLDLQNALLIMQWKILKDSKLKKGNFNALINMNFLQYFIAGSMGVANQGRRFHGHDNLVAELQRSTRARKNITKLLENIDKYVNQSGNKNSIKTNSIGFDLSTIEDLRSKYYNNGLEIENQNNIVNEDMESKVPGKSYVDSELGVSNRSAARQSHGKFYGHGRGGYYNFYDQQIKLAEAENDTYKNKVGFYQIPTYWKQTRTQIVRSLLIALSDKDPQKRLLIIHLLRRLIPDASMLPRVNKLIRELETIDKRPYRFIDTVLNKDVYECDENGNAIKNDNPMPFF